MTARYVVPEGDAVADHYCARCSEPLDWCLCQPRRSDMALILGAVRIVNEHRGAA